MIDERQEKQVNLTIDYDLYMMIKSKQSEVFDKTGIKLNISYIAGESILAGIDAIE